MSLIKCPECGKEISDKAEACVNCGFPIQEYLSENKIGESHAHGEKLEDANCEEKKGYETIDKTVSSDGEKIANVLTDYKHNDTEFSTNEEAVVKAADESNSVDNSRFNKTKKKLVVFIVLLLALLGIVSAFLSQKCFHDWQKATCTEPKTCFKCGAVKGEALGHDLTEATCTKPPKCKRCNGKDFGMPLGHKWKCVENKKFATCTEEGIRLDKCTVCNVEKEVIIPKINHLYETKTEKCIMTKTCKVCGYSVTGSEQHTWYFPSTYAITGCTYSTKSFNGKRLCKVCGKQVDGLIKYSASAFETTFCSWVNFGSYDEIARFPERESQYVMKFSGYVVQDCGNNCYRLATKGKYDDVIYVEFTGSRSTSSGRILEGDRVTVYGKPNKLYTYESVSGARITIPKFEAYYIH